MYSINCFASTQHFPGSSIWQLKLVSIPISRLLDVSFTVSPLASIAIQLSISTVDLPGIALIEILRLLSKVLFSQFMIIRLPPFVCMNVYMLY
jgi:hypothetical protein